MTNKIYVSNLNYSVTQDELREFFSSCGTVNDVSIPVDRETRRPRGFAFIEFASSDEVQKAIEMSGQSLKGRTVNISQARERN